MKETNRVGDPGSVLPLEHGHRETYDRELAQIQADIVQVGTYVEEAIRAATEAMQAHNAELAARVIAEDRRINDLQAQVSELITATIATQQPVARDLRYLLALDRVAHELERMGDHAGSVAKQVRKLAQQPPLRRYVFLPRMADLVAGMVHDILVALVAVDEAQARAVASRDDEVDRLYHASFDVVLDLMRADPENVDRGTRILFAAHYLERIGDRVTNIAEDILFLAGGVVEDLN
jgi:phosphate transport system protein